MLSHDECSGLTDGSELHDSQDFEGYSSDEFESDDASEHLETSDFMTEFNAAIKLQALQRGHSTRQKV